MTRVSNKCLHLFHTVYSAILDHIHYLNCHSLNITRKCITYYKHPEHTKFKYKYTFNNITDANVSLLNKIICIINFLVQNINCSQVIFSVGVSFLLFYLTIVLQLF